MFFAIIDSTMSFGKNPNVGGRPPSLIIIYEFVIRFVLAERGVC